MDSEFSSYSPRNFRFHRLVAIGDWQVKVYTISFKEEYGAVEVLENALAHLEDWMEAAQALNFPTHRAAFLIVHEGRDGVWSILNWWIGGEMLQMTTFYTSYEEPSTFRHHPNNSAMACVWELAVTGHERQAWINHVLKQADAPDWEAYFNDRLEGSL